MKSGLKIALGGAGALVVIAGLVGLSAWHRLREAEVLSQPFHVQTYTGTNYVLQLLETTIGRTDHGYVLIIYMRIQNPNADELVLPREWFVLVDHDKDYYQPSTTGTQSARIQVPANGTLDREMLSFVLPPDALDGSLGLQVGRNYWAMIKSGQPFRQKLRSGEFASFRRRDW